MVTPRGKCAPYLAGFGVPALPVASGSNWAADGCAKGRLGIGSHEGLALGAASSLVPSTSPRKILANAHWRARTHRIVSVRTTPGRFHS